VTAQTPNLPGNRLTALVVTYAPGARSARHHHACWGPVRSQNADGVVRPFDRAPKVHAQVDQHYVRLREELNRTFETIGLAPA